MKNNCYLTALSTDSYLIGVLILNESLKAVNASHPLCCLTIDNLKPETYKTLEKEGIKCFVQHPEFIVTQENIQKTALLGYGVNWRYTFFKIYMLGVPYEKIVFLDADTVVLQNVDELFDRPHFSACKDGELQFYKNNWRGVNSGVMVIEPNENELVNAVRLVNDYKEPGGDQDIFNLLNPGWDDCPELRLPKQYNMLFSRWLKGCFRDMPLSGEGTIKILHMIEKPWVDLGEERRWIDNEIKKSRFIYDVDMYKRNLFLMEYKKFETLALEKLRG